MTPARIILFAFLISLLTACSSTIEPDERVFGTWIEPLNGGVIEFREDRSMTWLGEDGTFDFQGSSNWAGCMFGRNGCDTGAVVVSLEDEDFRVGFRSESFDSDPDRFSLYPRNGVGFPSSLPAYGQDIEGFTVYREGTFEYPFVPEGFERFDGGLLGEGRFHQYMDHAVSINGTLVAEVSSAIRRFNEGTERWELIDEDTPDYVYRAGSSVLYDRASDPSEHNRYNRVSLDAGLTWKSVPSLEKKFSSNGNATADYVLVGNSIVASVSGESGGEAESTEIWAMDVSVASPSWSRKSVIHQGWGHYLVSELSGGWGIVLRFYQGDLVLEKISTDLGATWTPFELECDWSPVQHADGVACEIRGSGVRWYDNSTKSWTTYDLDLDHLVSSSAPTDGLYIIRGDLLIKWQPDGTETTLTELSRSLGGHGLVYALDDQLILSKITLWRKLR
jgi:hypothetical protein